MRQSGGVHHDEVAAGVRARLPRGRIEDLAQGAQMGGGELERELVRLVGGTSGVVGVGSGGHLDVAAEDVRDRAGRTELQEPVHGLRERGTVLHVEPPGVERVPGQQQARVPVVEDQRGAVVSRAGDQVQDPSAQVQFGRPVRPVGEPEVGRDLVQSDADDRGAGSVGELSVGRDVVAVAVRVGDRQLVPRSWIARQPVLDQRVDGRPQGKWPGSEVAPVSISSAPSFPKSRKRKGAS